MEWSEAEGESLRGGVILFHIVGVAYLSCLLVPQYLSRCLEPEVAAFNKFLYFFFAVPDYFIVDQANQSQVDLVKT